MSRIVQGKIGPIHAHDVRWGRLFGDQPGVQADNNHPITLALIEQLPKLTDAALKELRAHTARSDRAELGSASSPEDVKNWLRMIDAEMAYRQREKKGLVARVFAAFRGEK